MIEQDPIINTGRGKMRVGEAMGYFRNETERTPTTAEPRDTSILLGILRSLPLHLQNHAAHWVIKDYRTHPHLFEFETAQTLLRESRMIAYAPYGQKPNEMICFGDLSRTEMGQQCQYGSRYIDGKVEGYPNLGEGLRIQGKVDMYHSLLMHVDDVPVFLQRYREYCDARLRR